jgi:hypothetical protein
VLSATTDDHAQLMLRDIHTWLRKVENLSSLFHEKHIGSGKQLGTASTRRRMMNNYAVRTIHHLEGLAFMAKLTATLFG